MTSHTRITIHPPLLFTGLSEISLSALILLQCCLFIVEGTLEFQGLIDGTQLIIDGIFLIDIIIKVRAYGRSFWCSPVNILDTIVVLLSLGLYALSADPESLTALRILRLMRMFRVLRLIPNVDHILKGLSRAIRASRGVFLMLMILVAFFSILGYLLFSNVLPSHFADPILASYTVFSLFTVEGWNEIPNLISNTSLHYYSIRIYVISIIVFGSFFALSLANAIFIDEMVMDNNSEIEARLAHLTALVERQSLSIEQLNQKLSHRGDEQQDTGVF